MKSLNHDLSVPASKHLRVYNLPGIDRMVVARKGGPSASDIKNKPSYEKLRENQKEFGAASMIAKTLRETFTDGVGEICETYSSGKLTAKFRNLVKHEDGPTGTRPLCLSKHGHYLSGFEFNSTAPYEETFGAKYFIQKGSRRGQVILHFPAFIPEDTFKMPEGATNFKLFARLVALSDYTYHSEINSYCPNNKDIHGKYGVYQTPMLPILKIATEPMTTQVAIDYDEIPEDIGLFLVMGVSFFHYEHGRFTHMNKDSAMSIKQVY